MLTATHTIDVEVVNVVLVSELVGKNTQWGKVEAARKDATGTTFALTDTDNLLRYTEEGFVHEENGVDAAVFDSSGSLLLFSNRSVRLWNGMKWESTGIRNNAARLIQDRQGEVFVLTEASNATDGELHYWTGSKFEKSRGGVRAIMTDGDGDLLAWVNDDTVRDKAWNPVGAQVTQLVKDRHGTIYALTDVGNFFYWTGSKFEKSHGGVRAITTDGDGDLLAWVNDDTVRDKAWNPVGAQVTQLVKDRHGTIYALTDVGNFFYWTGSKFEKSHGGVRAITTDGDGDLLAWVNDDTVRDKAWNPVGAQVTQLVKDRHGTIYALTDVGNFFYWTGSKFEKSHGGVRAITTDAAM